MIVRKYQHWLKIIAIGLIIEVLGAAIFPSVAWALTSGSGAPEFASFEPVATTDMVNVQSGDFVYNLPVLQIPGADGGGYALSLSYHSGSSIEEESSWVGNGWTLNPGAINRTVRGFPDDYKNVQVQQYNKTRPNWSITSSNSVNLEFFSQDEVDKTKQAAADSTQYKPQSRFTTINASQSLRVNNYQGYNRSFSIGPGFKGAGSLAMQIAASGITFSANVNPVELISKALTRKKEQEAKQKAEQPTANQENENENAEKATSEYTLKERMVNVFNRLKNPGFNMVGSDYGYFTYADASYASVINDYVGFGLNFSTSFQTNPGMAPVGVQAGVSGAFNMQTNKFKNTLNTYGYAYNPALADKSEGDDLIMDYYVEKESSFEKRDYLLGVPFSNPDMFHVSGEGLGGGFRAYPARAGTFYPNFNRNSYSIVNTGVEFMAGANVGIGLDFGIGIQSTESKNWSKPGGSTAIQFTNDRPVFRFNGDLGGKVSYHDNKLASATVHSPSNFPGTKNGHLSTANLPTEYVNGSSAATFDESVGRSSHVKASYDPNGRIHAFENYNQDGIRYFYGQPAYIHNETNLTIDVDANEDRIVDEYIAYKQVHLNEQLNMDMEKHRTVVGQVKKENAAYVYSYLLTEITTPDYVDINNNGPDELDLGGWTKFTYNQVHDDYRYRHPYTGLRYDRGSVSDIKDDVGSFTAGEKDIFYLETIETKTHIARFRLSDRQDGLGAAPLGVNDPAAASQLAKDGTKQLKKLDRIDLYYKNADGSEHLIKSVRFAYDYSLAPHVPNNTGASETGTLVSANVNQNKGKLTLRKVWFEYEGITNAKISPFRFNYTYKKAASFEQEVRDRYPRLSDFFNLSDRYSGAMQNPDYNPHYLDAWGGYSAHGRQQHLVDRNWVWQGNIDQDYYDPGAWQLKQIILPSGGELLVEYEQTDYSSVQDRPVMAMAPIQNTQDGYADKQKYIVDLRDVGIDLPHSESIVSLAARMREYYLSPDRPRRIYWKFLYALQGANPNINNCQSDYISGYCKVKDIQPSGSHAIEITLDGSGSGYEDGYNMVPRQGCYDFVSTQRVGKFEAGCESEYEQLYDNAVVGIAANYQDGSGGLGRNILDFLHLFGFAVGAIAEMQLNQLADLDVQAPRKRNVCKRIDPQHSYFKVLMPRAKRGGGLRVKRLLAYDKGLETGDAVLYGSEYSYENEDGTSSGVATTEPGTMREENPLVEFLPRGNQTWFSRHTVGKDKEQAEGAVGESILPAPKVTHARVVIKNIYEGSTSNGFEVREYYTCKDYPYDKLYNYQSEPAEKYDFQLEKGMEYTDLAANTVDDVLIIPAGLITYQTNKSWAAQGFRFIMNSMDGQPKSSKKYGGRYEDLKNNPSKVYLAGAETTSYFEPGEKLLMLSSEDGKNIQAQWDTPGKEMDITMEMKSIKDKTMDFSLEVDISAALTFPPPIFVGLWPSFEYTEKTLSTHKTSKVIRYPAIAKSQQVYQDGVWSTSEFLAFDRQTGQALVTRTTDAYHNISEGESKHDGSIYAVSLPAHWFYKEMDQKAVNESNTNQLSASAGSISTYGEGANPVEDGNFAINLSNVVSAQVQTWSNTFERILGVWKPKSSYTYKTSREEHKEGELIQDAGTYSDFEPFSFTDVTLNGPKWLHLNEITKYNENGQAIEERNILNVYSATKFGYNLTVPILVAKNAREDQVYFEDYELSGNDAKAHSGVRAQRLFGTSEQIVPGIHVEHNLANEGGLLQLWAHVPSNQDPAFTLDLGDGGDLVSGERTAQSGAWYLYRFEISPNRLAVSVGQSIDISLMRSVDADNVIIDDVRFQPNQAEALCYVYDKSTLRLLAQFDDQHFGRFFQYNAEGKLIRKLIETERGVRTLQENHYNTPDEFRN